MTRVPVVDGHAESVIVKLKKQGPLDELKSALRNCTSLPQRLKLPSAPEHPVVLMEEVDRPQPRFDVKLEDGMATVVGRVRPCSIRGAAGATILNAELLKVQGLLD
jgi:aspartate-semialdehyde dehydrogenase